VRHEPFTEWATLYATGTLDGEERIQFEAHLSAGCPACTAVLSELSAVVATLAWAVPAVPPRPALREELLTRLRIEQEALGGVRRLAPRRSSTWVWWRRGLWAGRVAIACLIGVLGLTLYDAQVQLGKQRAVLHQLTEELGQERALTTLIAHTDTRVAALADPPPTTPTSAGWIVWSLSKRRGFMVVHFLPTLPPGKTYQLWAMTGQQALPAGVFQVDSVGHAALMVTVAVAHPDRFEITVEPVGGVTVPSGLVMLHGRP
jgi:anti-sigma-K factor RskA